VPALNPVHVTGLDHVVLLVADARRSLAWYQHLGLVPERVDEWAAGDAPFPSVRIDATTVIDLVEGPRSGVNADHLCLVVEPCDLDALAASPDLDVIEGPVPRWGAQGWATSVYVRDPDANVVELRHYGPTTG
jgi:catechol 2,3-dioxygenase-like lactoylglutathione lyase family enzyme